MEADRGMGSDALAADRPRMSRHLRPTEPTRRPSVTVVVPCYNYGHYLPQALATVLTQPGVDVEAIVIDDASPDGSASVVRELAAADARVRPILHTHNRGHIATYNEGLDQATGDYVVLMSADDALTAGSLARATALLEAHPSVGFAYGFPVVFAHDLPPAESKVRSWTIWSGEEWIERRCRKGENCIHCPEVVMRTSVQHAIGGYDPDLPHSGDMEMWLRAASVSHVGRVNGPGQAYYRVHDASMQRTRHAGHLVDLQGRLDAFEKALVGPRSRLDQGDELFATARRALAVAALDYACVAYEHRRPEPVEGYRAFAERVWPRARELRRWRAVDRRADAGRARLERGWKWRSRRAARDLESRLRWRKWRRSGV
jgi:glycosyltransferase involved in cell wall biosynthesis